MYLTAGGTNKIQKKERGVASLRYIYEHIYTHHHINEKPEGMLASFQAFCSALLMLSLLQQPIASDESDILCSGYCCNVSCLMLCSSITHEREHGSWRVDRSSCTGIFCSSVYAFVDQRSRCDVFFLKFGIAME